MENKTYSVEFKPKAIKELNKISKPNVIRILNKIEALEKGLTGDIKQLTNYSPEYRLRVGNYRVLFEVEGQKIIIYHIKHRKEAYFGR